MKNTVCLAAVLCLLSAVLPSFAEGATGAVEPGYAVASRVDWAAGCVILEVRHDLDPATASITRAKGDAETDLEARLAGFVARALGPVVVDSSHTFGDLLAADAALYARVTDIALRARRTEISLTQDFTALVARYVIPFYGAQGVAAPLFPSRATTVRRGLGEVSTRVYTGLLIYATGQLRAVGSTRPAAARPALFPRLWDETMGLVWEKGMCSPEALATWGMAGCATSPEDPAVLARVGAVPLRLAARAVFGDNATDLVISTDGARQLLALDENIALLREGRVAIIYDSLE
jgi:hypothetical protein